MIPIHTVAHHAYQFAVHASHRVHTVVHTVYFGLVGLEAHGRYRYAAAVLCVAAIAEAGHDYYVKLYVNRRRHEMIPGEQSDKVVVMAKWKEDHK